MGQVSKLLRRTAANPVVRLAAAALLEAAASRLRQPHNAATDVHRDDRASGCARAGTGSSRPGSGVAVVSGTPGG